VQQAPQGRSNSSRGRKPTEINVNGTERTPSRGPPIFWNRREGRPRQGRYVLSWDFLLPRAFIPRRAGLLLVGPSGARTLAPSVTDTYIAFPGQCGNAILNSNHFFESALILHFAATQGPFQNCDGQVRRTGDNDSCGSSGIIRGIADDQTGGRENCTEDC
jgi:hypothetical protein